VSLDPISDRSARSRAGRSEPLHHGKPISRRPETVPAHPQARIHLFRIPMKAIKTRGVPGIAGLAGLAQHGRVVKVASPATRWPSTPCRFGPAIGGASRTKAWQEAQLRSPPGFVLGLCVCSQDVSSKGDRTLTCEIPEGGNDNRSIGCMHCWFFRLPPWPKCRAGTSDGTAGST
jgi:hypothetical protein